MHECKSHAAGRGDICCQIPHGVILLLEPKQHQAPKHAPFGIHAAGVLSEYLIWKAVCKDMEGCSCLAQCSHGDAGIRRMGTAAAQ